MAILKRSPKTGKKNPSFFIMPVPYDVNTAAIGDMLIKEGYEINKNLFFTNQGYNAQLEKVPPIGDIIEDQIDKYDDAVDIYAIEIGISDEKSLSSFVHENFIPEYTPNSKVNIIVAQTDGEIGPRLTENIGYIDVTEKYFNDSSLKTVAEKIGHKLTNEEEFIAAYDTAGVRGIQELAHGKRMSERQANKIVSQIVAADERLQGITEEEIWEARRSVDNMEVVEDVALIAVNHDKCLPVINELEMRFGMYGNVFIMCDTGEVDFYGDSKTCHALKEEYGGWIGDTRGKISFWGNNSDAIDKTECIEFIIRNMKGNKIKDDKAQTEVGKTQTGEEISEKIEITDITLLTKEEAEKLPHELRVTNSGWWLRSPGNTRYSNANVYSNGSVNSFVVNYDDGVRPALKISNLKSVNLTVGDKFEMAGQKWTVINGHTALCDVVVGKTCFREDYKAPDANDYEASDVKKWLEKWAKERGIVKSEGIEITDITLLTEEEAKALSEDQRNIGIPWWLRSPGNNQYYAAIVSYGGALDYYIVNHSLVDVRPALKISNLKSMNLSIGDSFEKAGQKWTIINENTALCDDIVGKAIFDKKDNDYEKSDIKKWLENWARERGLVGKPVSIPIDEEHFPDDNFREFLLKQPYGKNGKLTPKEIKGITEINCECPQGEFRRKISDLTGIEFFTELKALYCGDNTLRSLNISNNPKLEILHCEHNKLKSLDISNNPELRYLNCKENQLEVLDISNWRKAELAEQISTSAPCYGQRGDGQEFADLTGQPEGFVLITGIDLQPDEKITILKSMLPRVIEHDDSYIIYKANKTNKEELLNFLNAHPEHAELVTELKRYCKKELIREAQRIYYEAPPSETNLSKEGYSAVGEVIDELETMIKDLAKIQKRNEILDSIEEISLPTVDDMQNENTKPINDWCWVQPEWTDWYVTNNRTNEHRIVETHNTSDNKISWKWDVVPGDSEHHVRPVLKTSESLPAGQKFTIAGYEWTAINKDTLMCDGVIGNCCFEREKNRTADYEGSKIKNWLETWAAERGLTKGMTKGKDEPSKEEERKKDELMIIEPKTREIHRKKK